MPKNTIHTPALSADEPLIPELQTYCDRLSAIKDRAAELTEGLTERQFNWKPTPDRWSVAQCLDHLNVAGYQLLPRLKDTIQNGRKNETYGEPPFRYGLVSRWFIRFNEPSSGFKMKTFKVYTPSSNQSLDKDVVVSKFEQLQEELAVLAQEANGLDLRRIKVPSPVSSFLRLSLGAWFAATIAHEQRHLNQAKKVKNDPNFPTSTVM